MTLAAFGVGLAALAGPRGVHLADLVLAVLAAEAVLLLVLHRRSGAGLAPRDLVGLLGAGLFLALALRGALAGWSILWVAACLAGAFVAHLDDLRRRWRS